MLATFRHLFTPHYTNNHRARIIHPAGLTVLTALFLLSQSLINIWKYLPALPEGLVLGYASNISATQVVELTNVERAKIGLPSLHYSTQLSEAAAQKATHMFVNDYWAHVAPDGTTPWVFINQAGYRYTIAGENLARDFDASDVMLQAWMNSPTHKENIVNAKYSEIGVAVVDGKLQGLETTLVVQMFGAPVQVAQAPAAEIGQSGTTPLLPTGIAAQTQQTGEPTGIPAAETVAVVEEVDDTEAPGAQEQLEEVLQFDSALGTTLTSHRASSLPESLISPLQISKALGTSIVLMVMMVLVYDMFYIHRKKIPRLVGKNWAHLTFFSLVVIFILGLTQGRIL